MEKVSVKVDRSTLGRFGRIYAADMRVISGLTAIFLNRWHVRREPFNASVLMIVK